MPGSHPYPRTSRYHDAEIGVHRKPDATEVRYAKHRLLPKLPADPEDTVVHVVGAGERPDQLGHATSAIPGSGGGSPTPTRCSIRGS